MAKEKIGAYQPTPRTDRPVSQYRSSSGYIIRQGKSSEYLAEFVGVLLLRLIAGQAEPSGWQLLEGLLHRVYAEGLL
ncbi:MAG: hypothetical protein ABR913_00350 [Sedimentisphaerales bacterium]|jgi:hypothetical protein